MIVGGKDFACDVVSAAVQSQAVHKQNQPLGRAIKAFWQKFISGNANFFC